MGRRFAAQMGAPLMAQSIEIASLETRERIGAGESVYRISGAPAGSADRVV